MGWAHDVKGRSARAESVYVPGIPHWSSLLVHEIALDGAAADAALAYVMRELGRGRLLSQCVLQDMMALAERVLTFLPGGIGLTQMLEFETAKLHMSPGASAKTSDEWLVHRIARCFQQEPRSVLLAEDFVSSPTDPWLPTFGCRFWSIGDDVLHYTLAEGASEAMIGQTLNDAACACALVGAVAALPMAFSRPPSTTRIDESDLRAICVQTKIAFVRVYDGESFLLIEFSEDMASQNTPLDQPTDDNSAPDAPAPPLDNDN